MHFSLLSDPKTYPGQFLAEYLSSFGFNNEFCRQTICSLHNMVWYVILPLTKQKKKKNSILYLLFQESNHAWH